MPYITVSWFTGRSKEQKAALAKEMTDVFTRVAKTPKEHVWIVFQDVPKSEWSMGGELQA
jgi:4-oxalocrotonate tautomerase